MQIATTNNQSQRPHFVPTYYSNKKENEKMSKIVFVKFLRKFFWMSKADHGHSDVHLSDHLKRDIGLIDSAAKPNARNNDSLLPKLPIGNIWL